MFSFLGSSIYYIVATVLFLLATVGWAVCILVCGTTQLAIVASLLVLCLIALVFSSFSTMAALWVICGLAAFPLWLFLTNKEVVLRVLLTFFVVGREVGGVRRVMKWGASPDPITPPPVLLWLLENYTGNDDFDFSSLFHRSLVEFVRERLAEENDTQDAEIMGCLV